MTTNEVEKLLRDKMKIKGMTEEEKDNSALRIVKKATKEYLRKNKLKGFINEDIVCVCCIKDGLLKCNELGFECKSF